MNMSRRNLTRAALCALGIAVVGAALLAGNDSSAQGAGMPAPNIAYRLQTAFRGPGECLEGNRADSPGHDGAAFMDRCQNVTGQAWLFEHVGDGFYRLRTRFQGQNKCLEGNQASSPHHNGSAFLDDCQNVTGQLWKLTPAGNDNFRLQNAFRGQGECLEGNQASSPAHGGNAFMDQCQNVSGQLWSLRPF